VLRVVKVILLDLLIRLRIYLLTREGADLLKDNIIIYNFKGVDMSDPFIV
jgi:hypothetical protein